MLDMRYVRKRERGRERERERERERAANTMYMNASVGLHECRTHLLVVALHQWLERCIRH
jgi:hypothetical protein